MIAGLILAEIGPEIGQSVKWDASWVESGESLRKLLIDAGLIVERVYKSEAYETFEYKAGDGHEIFEKTVANPMFRNIGEPAIKDKAKKLFVDKIRGMAEEDGMVHEEVRFYMGIARKQTSG